MALRACISLALVSLLLPALAWGRTWTNRDGKTVEGDFVRLDGETVVLLVGGKEARVPLASLSDGDQAYAKLFNPTPTESPAPQSPALGEGAAPALAPTAPKDPSVPDLSRSRKWTDRAGRSVSAVLSSVAGGTVYLKAGSRLQTVSYAQLCDEDQEALRKYLEYQGQGLQVPAGAKDLPDQSLRSWRDKNDKSVPGILRRVDPDGSIVIQLATRTAAFPLDSFSPTDQEHIREQVAALGGADLLPADDSIRTWRDWRGRQFTGKLDPLFPASSISSTVHFKLATGQPKSLSFVALSEADRDYLRQLIESQGGGRFLPDSFPEPETEIRIWTMNDGATSVEGKFVRVAGASAVLRTETQHNRQCPLTSLSAADRRYIEQVLASRGESEAAPLVADDCRKWVYGPAGRGNTLTARFGDAAEGYVKLLLPNEARLGKDRGYVVLPYLCLSDEDQELVKAEWTGSPAALVPLDDTVTLDVRDWSLSDDQRALRGKLLYVTHDSVTISERGVPRKEPFSQLSAEDMDYVQRIVALQGMAKFDPPAASAGVVSSGVVSAPASPPVSSQPAHSRITMPKSASMSAYEVTVAIFYSLGFVLLLVTIAAVLMKVLN
ncbi:MAG: hypothetical protein L0211_08920 [Planctomycetaceae bacterium]|nr:hypothetical protein [Planctomycetaceae bacterium]